MEPGLMNWVPLGLLPWVWGAHLYRHLGTSLPSYTVGLASTLRRAGLQAPDLLVVDHPQFYNLDLVLSPRRVLYRACDLFAEIHDRRIVNDIERALVTRVDCVIATSEPVAQRLRDHGRTTVTLFENGVEFAHMSHPVPPPAEYARLRPRRADLRGRNRQPVRCRAIARTRSGAARCRVCADRLGNGRRRTRGIATGERASAWNPTVRGPSGLPAACECRIASAQRASGKCGTQPDEILRVRRGGLAHRCQLDAGVRA